jgi:hypothetical protein
MRFCLLLPNRAKVSFTRSTISICSGGSHVTEVWEDEGPREAVNPADLLSSAPVTFQEFPDPPPRRLPLNSMPWENFERLCARLLVESDAEVLQAFRYGVNAQGQGGIDILATIKLGDQKLVAECKRVRKITPGEITHWIDRFFTRDDLHEIRQFIFAITVDVEKNKHLVEAWFRACARLAKHNIQARLWDLSQLEQELAARPELIELFFGSAALDRFGRRLAVQVDWPSRYRKQAELLTGNSAILENLSVRADILLPTERRPGISVLLAFTRADMRGMPLAIAPDLISRWMQWAAYSPSLEDAPFLLSDASDRKGRRAFLQAGVAMPLLEANEVRHLHWVLSSGWRHLLRAIRQIDDRWKAVRFPVQWTQSEPKYCLCSVSEEFWKAIVAYAAEFDATNGSSDQHIYRACPTAIVVYASESRVALQPGYHVNLSAAKETGGALYGRNDIAIFWKPLEICHPVVYSPDQAWDAEHSHAWLMTSFLPSVLAWALQRERKSLSFVRRLADHLVSGEIASVPLEVVAHSVADRMQASDALHLQSVGEARQMAEHLQSHFSMYGTDPLSPAIEIELNRRVLRLVERFLPGANEDTRAYICNKVGRLDGSPEEQVSAAIELEVEPGSRYAVLEHSLRALAAVLCDVPPLTVEQLRHISEQLQPLWRQRREDSFRKAYCG